MSNEIYANNYYLDVCIKHTHFYTEHASLRHTKCPPPLPPVTGQAGRAPTGGGGGGEGGKLTPPIVYCAQQGPVAAQCGGVMIRE
jgi:hypothetical protein